MGVSVKVFVSVLVVMILAIMGIVVFSPSDGVEGVVLENNTLIEEPEVGESNFEAEYLIEKCNISLDECRGELERAISGAAVDVKEGRFFEEFKSGNAFFEENKGESQEGLRRELSSFNEGDVDFLFPIVLYSVVLKGPGGEKDLVVVCNSFGDLEMTSRNWLFC